jgi:arylsulfatase A-like enzyme/Tfp pilus assembly protein PilF
MNQRTRLIVSLALLGAATFLGACARPERLNVVLVSFDTTRADRLGCYGNEDIETPVVDGLARDGVLFDRAYSSAPITAPSHATILTGQYPIVHGVRDNGMFTLADDQLTLAEVFRENGYRTAAAIGGFPLVAKFGFDQGFDLFDDHLSARFEDLHGQRRMAKRNMFFEERPAAMVNEAIYGWLREDSSKPFFLWVHYYDPHQPLDPPMPYRDNYADDLYNGEIAYTDARLGDLIEELKSLGQWERTLIVMVGDHGEGLGEHKEFTHAILVYNSTMRIPLIVRHPSGVRGRVVHEPVGAVDIAPTVLALADLPIPDNLQGSSLAAAILTAESTVPTDRQIYAENLSTRLSHNWGELRVLYSEGYKYIHGPRPELFNLNNDPDELHNLIDTEPEMAERYRSQLQEFIKATVSDGPIAQPDLTEEDRQLLIALGYLSPGGSTETIIEELRSDGDPPQDRVVDNSGLSRARGALRQKNYLEAREYLLELLKVDPDSSVYLEFYASACLGLNQVDEAWRALEKIRDAYSAGALPQRLVLQLAAIRFLQGQHEVALEMLESHQEANPTAAGLQMLAWMYGRFGRVDEESETLERALEIDPAFVTARVDLAVSFARRGDVERAEQEFRLALEDDPYSAKAHYNFGAFLVEQGLSTDAAPHFERAVALAPGYLTAYYAAIAINLELGDRDHAETLFADLASRAPKSDEAAMARSLLETHS